MDSLNDINLYFLVVSTQYTSEQIGRVPNHPKQSEMSIQRSLDRHLSLELKFPQGE